MSGGGKKIKRQSEVGGRLGGEGKAEGGWRRGARKNEFVINEDRKAESKNKTKDKGRYYEGVMCNLG